MIKSNLYNQRFADEVKWDEDESHWAMAVSTTAEDVPIVGESTGGMLVARIEKLGLLYEVIESSLYNQKIVDKMKKWNEDESQRAMAVSTMAEDVTIVGESTGGMLVARIEK